MKVQNTLTRKLDEITPLEDNKIKLYTCGLTVYSQPHIGNWVAYIYWDVLVRALKDAGYDVTRVQNITDVGHLTSDEDAGEDKMLKGALTEGITAWQVAEKYMAIADDEAYNKLGLLRPDHMPRATEYISQQIAFVEELEKKGYTYVIADGVYFDTNKLSDYGKLARLDIEGLQFGARVADTGKKNPTDFAVWKFSDPAEKRDMEWDSPWGKGFPGWHLECSVMARELLGDQIDIHSGGIDHIPVHHTNEIAQSEAVTGKQFSNYWLHNNHLKVEGEKMAKSIGNIYTLQDLTDKGFDLEAFKLMILSKHYRTEGNFTWDILKASQNRLSSYRAMADHVWQASEDGAVSIDDIEWAQANIRFALQNDLSTPQALTVLSQLEDAITTKGIAKASQAAFKAFLDWIDDVLGLTLSKRADISNEQQLLIKERQEARDDQNWEIADRLRNQLLEQGIEIKDTPRGQIWNRV
jgi:cysteinyl-tRNA synthetase